MMKLLLCIFRWCGGMRLYAYVMPLCVLLMILQRVVVLLCCGLSFGGGKNSSISLFQITIPMICTYLLMLCVPIKIGDSKRLKTFKFWYVMSCSLVEILRSFGGTNYLRLQCSRRQKTVLNHSWVSAPDYTESHSREEQWLLYDRGERFT